ncbi:hypothetical protein L1D19_21730 [Vibrio natriegens]|uniref:hypothetical protein n=1 Tax=Vibrio natriegens TaxID=691 RepID=UPI001EFC71CB|nr:hypothetical protein [Vibrio natriegens]MCG9702691.1 hypothetical protein [Vibrio natriegens]
MDTDFQFTLQLLQRFFKQPKIQHRLQLITEHDITGWEIWLQVELACFINDHEDISEWYRECQYSVDKRLAKTRQHMAIDFAFRRKRTKKDRYIALEIKQNLNVTQCIHNMVKDIEKVWWMRSSEDDIRSMWCLGVHPTSNDASLKQVVNKYAQQYEFELDEQCIHYQDIDGTKWRFTLI